MPELPTPPGAAVESPGDAPARSADGEPPAHEPTLLDVLGRVLDRGIVFDPASRAALPALDLAGGEAIVTVATREARDAGGADDGRGWDALVAAAERADAAAGRRAPDGRERDAAGHVEAWRSGEHAALRRQFERLDA